MIEGESFPFWVGFYGKVLNCLHSAVRNYLHPDPSLDKVDAQTRAQFISQGPAVHS